MRAVQQSALAFFFAIALAGEHASAAVRTQPIVYAALGDSITLGWHAKAGCLSAGFIPPSQCPLGSNYVDRLARMLSSSQRIVYKNFGRKGTRVLTIPLVESPKLPPSTNLVTLYVGVTDEEDVGMGGPQALQSWEEDFLYAVASVRSAAPRARIILATLPDIAYFPAYVPGQPDALSFVRRDRTARAVGAMNAFIRRLPYEIVDLACDRPGYERRYHFGYDAQTQSMNDPIHPNDAGYAHLAKLFYDAVMHRSRPPRAQCAPYSDPPPEDLHWLESL